MNNKNQNESVTDAQAQNAGEAKSSDRKRGRPPGKAEPVSLYHLSFEDAVRGCYR